MVAVGYYGFPAPLDDKVHQFSLHEASSRVNTALFRGAEHDRARRTPLYGFAVPVSTK